MRIIVQHCTVKTTRNPVNQIENAIDSRATINIKTLLCLATLWSIAACSQSGGGPDFATAPELSPNPNERAPLVALLDFDAPDAVRTVVTLNDGDRQWDIEFDGSPQDIPFPIFGMRAGKRHDFEVTIFDAEGNATTWDGELIFESPPLPTDRYVMPYYEVSVADQDRMEPGITVLSIRHALNVRPQDRSPGQQAFVEGYGLLLALDSEGEVVWYYQSDDRIAGIDRLANGNLLYHMASFTAVEMDWLGNRVRSWTPENKPEGIPRYEDSIPIKGIQTLHHQPHEVGEGNFLSFSANWRIIENWYTNEFDPEPRKDQKVMGDTIIEFDKEGNILWEWNAFDHLDTDMIGYEAFNPYWVTRRFPDTWDWSHGNGVAYDPRDDSVIASFKLLDAVIKVDRESGEIKWIFGDHHGWKGELKDKLLTPIGDDFRWPWHQHNPRWTHAGTLLVFNNNRGQAKPFDGRPHAPFNETWSYSVEYDIDEEAMTVSQAWISEPEITPDSCNSMAMSESHRLPKTDNILEINALCQKSDTPNVTWDIWDRSKRYLSEIPHGGRVREFTRTSPADIVFDVSFKDPHGVLNWQVYGGFRMSGFYETSQAH